MQTPHISGGGSRGTFCSALERQRLDGNDPSFSSQSSVLSGVESQLLVFFKSSPNSTQQPVPPIFEFLLVLTYVALIFSVSATISSLVLTENFGNVPMLVAHFREKVKYISTPKFETANFRSRINEDITPRRWRWIEWHCTHHILCLQERNR